MRSAATPNSMEAANHAMVNASFKERIKDLFEDPESFCNQITLVILEFIVLHILATTPITDKKLSELKIVGRASKIYSCFKEITKAMFPLDGDFQIDLSRHLTMIVEEVMASPKERRMVVLDKYLGKYVISTWIIVDQDKNPVNLNILKHYLNVKDLKPVLAIKKVKYMDKGFFGEPLGRSRIVSVRILKVCPSETRDENNEFFIKSLVLFKCPECERNGLLNYVVSEYEFLFPFLYFSSFIDPCPMCQEGHEYWMENALRTIDLS